MLPETTIDDLRRARAVSEEDLAEVLEIPRAAVAEQVRCPDWRISTLRRYIEALGGRLELIAHFQDQSIILRDIGTDIERNDAC